MNLIGWKGEVWDTVAKCQIVVVHKHGVEGMEMESSDWSIVFQHLV